MICQMSILGCVTSSVITDSILYGDQIDYGQDYGVLTRGRGMSEAVRLLWTHIIHKCSEVHSAMGDITGNKLNTSEQHV